MVRLLICGSREWNDPEPIRRLLATYATEGVTIIHGAARGADSVAEQLARGMGLAVERFPADWRGQGKAAGAIRNRLMLTDGKPDAVYAFKDGFDWSFSRGGTENMVRIAEAAGIPVCVYDHADAS